MRRILTLTLVSLLLLSACGGGDEGDSTTTSAVVSATTTEPDTTTTRAVDTTTTSEVVAAATTTEAVSAGGGGSDCLVGTWTLDSAAFVENFSEILDAQGMPDASAEPLDGSFTVEMSGDGTLSATRDAWGFTINSSQGDITIEVNGTEVGTWAAEGSTLTVDTDTSDLTVDASVSVNGEQISLPGGQVPVEVPEGIATDGTFTCSGDTFTLENGGVESIFTRG